jgi:hypothetical protein
MLYDLDCTLDKEDLSKHIPPENDSANVFLAHVLFQPTKNGIEYIWG